MLEVDFLWKLCKLGRLRAERGRSTGSTAVLSRRADPSHFFNQLKDFPLDSTLLKWILFNAFVLVLLILDLGVVHRKAHVIKMKEALIWSAIWTVLALAFNVFVWLWHGTTAALEFTAGYLIERALSMDNIFVFVLIFSYFQVPEQFQHRVLFWGIFGALVMRGIFIAAGVALIYTFHWITYVFGAFLIFTGIKMALQKEQGVHPERNPLIRFFTRMFPVTRVYHGKRFFVKIGNVRYATPLFIVLLMVEFTDVVFATDSIPAVFAVTKDPFIIYTSNIFAILGLRALYFAVAGVMREFHFLKFGLSVVLTFVGVKMLLAETPYKIPIGVSLGVIAAVLTLSIIASLIWPKKSESPAPTKPKDEAA